MRTQEFDKVKPYTYFIIRKSDNKKYHGVRYANIKLGLSPKEDFGKEYFGSSSGSFCKKFEKDISKFKYKIAWTFDSKTEATHHEAKVNRKILKRSDWVNKSAWPQMIMDKEIRAKISLGLEGRPVSAATKRKIRLSLLGHSFSQETIRKMSLRKIGRKLSSEHKRKIGLNVKGEKNGNFGRTFSVETRKKMSLRKVGRTLSAEHKRKVSLASLGRKHSIASKRKISLANSGEKSGMFGKTHSAEARRKISLSGLGRIVSTATRRKIRLGNLGKHSARKGLKLKLVNGRRTYV